MPAPEPFDGDNELLVPRQYHISEKEQKGNKVKEVIFATSVSEYPQTYANGTAYIINMREKDLMYPFPLI